MCNRANDHLFQTDSRVSLCAAEVVMKGLRIEGLRWKITPIGVGVEIAVRFSDRHPEAQAKFLAALRDLESLLLRKTHELYDTQHLN